jgi:hypothetical protein
MANETSGNGETNSRHLNSRDFMRGAALAVAGVAASVGSVAVARRHPMDNARRR